MQIWKRIMTEVRFLRSYVTNHYTVLVFNEFIIKCLICFDFVGLCRIMLATSNLVKIDKCFQLIENELAEKNSREKFFQKSSPASSIIHLVLAAIKNSQMWSVCAARIFYLFDQKNTRGIFNHLRKIEAAHLKRTSYFATV